MSSLTQLERVPKTLRILGESNEAYSVRMQIRAGYINRLNKIISIEDYPGGVQKQLKDIDKLYDLLD
jgi:hypothetical protein